MKIEFFDHTAGVQMLVVESPNTAFVSNIFNLFMGEMINLHGGSFKKLSDSADDKGVHLVYTHNITGTIIP